MPTPEDHRHRRRRSDLWSRRTDEGRFDAAAAAWAMKRVAPLDQRVRKDRRLEAWRRRRGGRRLREAAALPSPEVAEEEEEEAAERVAPRLPGGLVSMKAPLVNSPPDHIHNPTNTYKNTIKINNNLLN